MFQNKVLKDIITAPWYCCDADIYRDLKITAVAEEIILAAKRHKKRLANHLNKLAFRLFNTEGKLRRLKRTKLTNLM